MTPLKKIAEQITQVEARLTRNRAALDEAQRRWDDWKVANLRKLVAFDVNELARLRSEQAAAKPAGTDSRGGAVFYGSPF